MAPEHAHERIFMFLVRGESMSKMRRTEKHAESAGQSLAWLCMESRYMAVLRFRHVLMPTPKGLLYG